MKYMQISNTAGFKNTFISKAFFLLQFFYLLNSVFLNSGEKTRKSQNN